MNAIAAGIVLIVLIAALSLAVASATGSLTARANLRRARLREIPTASDRARGIDARPVHRERAGEGVWTDPHVPLAQSVLPERWEHRGAGADRSRGPSLQVAPGATVSR